MSCHYGELATVLHWSGWESRMACTPWQFEVVRRGISGQVITQLSHIFVLFCAQNCSSYQSYSSFGIVPDHSFLFAGDHPHAGTTHAHTHTHVFVIKYCARNSKWLTGIIVICPITVRFVNFGSFLHEFVWTFRIFKETLQNPVVFDWFILFFRKKHGHKWRI